MSKGKNIILIILVLAAVIVAAALGYGYLTNEYTPEESQAQPGDPIPAPDFTVIDEKNMPVSLSNFRGKPTIVNFWATWCGPCEQELPFFDSAFKLYGDKVNFVMLNVDGDMETVDEVKEFVRQRGYSFPLYFDVTYDASQTYGVSAIPVTMCVSAEGDIIWSKIGMVSEDELIRQIKSMTGAE